MGWRLVLVPAYVPGSPPGKPTHPIVLPPESELPPWAPGHPEHPIPPTVWPNPPGQGPGNPPGFWGGTPPEYIDIGLPGPQPPSGGGSPPGFWGGRPPEWIDNTLPQPQPPGGGGAPPGYWGGVAPPWVDTTPPQPQPSPGWPPVVMPPIYYPPTGGGGGEPPGYWGGRPPEYVDIGLPLPQPPPGHVMPPIYLPPVVWPDPPEGLPSFDPDQIPGHPDLPDLNHGVWYWVDNDGAMERAFIAQVVRPGHDLPGYQPKLPPEEAQPGNWVVCLVNAQRPAWAWVPTPVPETSPDDPHVEHHDKAGSGSKAGKA